MIHIAIGSTNPVKAAAVQAVVSQIWPAYEVFALEVDTGVPLMPMSDAQCIAGARNRARAALRRHPADFGVGIEGGVHAQPEGMMLTAWAVVVDAAGGEGIGGGGRLPLPANIAARIHAGEELGPLMDRVLGETDVRRKGGAVGALTAGLFSRTEALAVAVAYAMAPFLAPELYCS
jgi:inosine/xanthosine triphosphatase